MAKLQESIKNGNYIKFDKFQWKGLDKSSAFSKTKHNNTASSDDYTYNMMSNLYYFKL